MFIQLCPHCDMLEHCGMLPCNKIYACIIFIIWRTHSTVDWGIATVFSVGPTYRLLIYSFTFLFAFHSFCKKAQFKIH